MMVRVSGELQVNLNLSLTLLDVKLVPPSNSPCCSLMNITGELKFGVIVSWDDALHPYFPHSSRAPAANIVTKSESIMRLKQIEST